MTDISVLLAVRDWDLTRVDACLRSLRRSAGVRAELVVVDYGSAEPSGIREMADSHGCTFLRVEANEWSRSNALNAAARASSGRNLIFADGDFVFAPTVLSRAVEILDSDPNEVLVFQARDLPSTIVPEDLLESPDFDHLDAEAVWRPRWGMGAQAQSRSMFNRIRGFDDRMRIYGGEDNDIAKRVRAHGGRIRWINSRDLAIFHVWHPSSRVAADSSKDTKVELQKNVDIAKNDSSTIRNLDTWRGEDPLVSVVITTHNRAAYLKDSIASVLNQTVQDFEIIVLDDGSTDETESVVEGFADSRIRYFKEPKTGIPALRNKAARVSNGRFTAVHDDDDIMTPWSIERRLAALSAGVVASFGGAYDFDNETGEMTLFPGRKSELATVLNGGKVSYHATLLIETDVLRQVGYDESFQSGSDYNLSIRLLKSGVKLEHCGDVVLLRRLHRRQVTVIDQAIQHGASYATTFAQRAAWGANSRWRSRERSKEVQPWNYSPELVAESRFYPFLPDHLVHRAALVALEEDADLPINSVGGRIVSEGRSCRAAFLPRAEASIFNDTAATSESRYGEYIVRSEAELEPADLLRGAAVSAFPDRGFVLVNPDLLDQGFTVFADLDAVEQSRTWAERENGCAIVCRPESSSVRDFIAAIAGPELA